MISLDTAGESDAGTLMLFCCQHFKKVLKPGECIEKALVSTHGLKKCPAMQPRAWSILLDSGDLTSECILLQTEMNGFLEVEERQNCLLTF